MKKSRMFAAIIALALAFSTMAAADTSGLDTLTPAPELITMPDNTFPSAAQAGEDAQGDTLILLRTDGAQIIGDGALVDETGNVVITAAGSYQISGAWADHTLTVDTQDDKKVTLYLNGVSIAMRNAPCLLALSASKNVTLELVKGSINLLSSAYDAAALAADGAYDAAIYSKADLKIKGEGALYIACTGGKGVNCRDDLEISGGGIHVQADDDGLRGKDSVTINGGLIRVDAGADGIRANNDTDAGKGNIIVSGGEVYVVSAGDGLQAYNALDISGGVIACVCGGGAAAAPVKTGDNWGGMGARGDMGGFGGGFGGRQSSGAQTQTTQEDTVSTKALKADVSVSISGGTLSLDSADDAIHANGAVSLSGGDLYITAGDDGVHGDETLSITGGNILIAQSYEGLESAAINLSGGVTRLIASDDGVNAAGGALNTSADARGFGRGMMETSGGTLSIAGGYLFVNAAGDGLDCNGNASMTGGYVIVYGPTNSGNGPLDYGGTFTMTGGTLMASGSAGMAQTVEADGVGEIAFTCSMSADTLLAIQDESGENAILFASPKDYGCVVFCSDALTSGQTYSVYAGGTASGQATEGVYQGAYTPGTLLGTLSAD